MANIKLRIVGIYFHKDVTIDKKSKITIKDVLDEYIAIYGGINQPEGLMYVDEPIEHPSGKPDRGSRSLQGFAYNSTNPPKTLSGKPRDPGVYSLFENYPKEGDVGLGWQSYVLDKNGRNKTETKVSEGFKYFDATEVKDEDTVIWRMVAIARRPNFPKPTVLG